MLNQRPILLAAAAGACLAAGGCVSGPQAKYTRDVELTFRLPPGAGLAVEAENGAIDLTEAARDDVLVRARIRAISQERADAVEIVADSSSADGLEIFAAWPTRRDPNEGVAFEVEAPGGRPVRAHTSNGAVVVTGFAGGADLKTSNGAIRVQGHRGPVTAATSNGAIVMRDVDGPVGADTSNGAVRVELSDAGVGPVRIDTSNGAVSLGVGPAFAGLIEAETSNGTVALAGALDAQPVRLIRDGRNSKAVQVGPDLGEGIGEPSVIDTSNGSVQITVRR